MKKERKNRKTVALLVLNYNSKPFLKSCLRSLLAQDGGRFQLLFIDNASTDGSVEFLKKNFPQIKIVKNSENWGVGKGFNGVIKKIAKRFDYIGLFNPDIKVDKSWLKESVSTLDNYPKVEICTSLILDWTGSKVDTAGGRIINILAGIFGGFLGNLPAGKIPSKYRKGEFPVFFGIVTAMLVRASAFERFGFFDEGYFMYFEDIDFSWRVLLGGGKILCNPRAIVYHYGHGAKASKKISLKLLKYTEINLLATYAKNLSLPGLILTLPPVFFIRLVASLFYLPISPKITWAKINGLFVFLGKLFSSKYRKQRMFVARIRKLTDYQVLALNPTSIFSFRPIFLVITSWFETIRGIYSRSS